MYCGCLAPGLATGCRPSPCPVICTADLHCPASGSRHGKTNSGVERDLQGTGEELRGPGGATRTSAVGLCGGNACDGVGLRPGDLGSSARILMIRLLMVLVGLWFCAAQTHLEEKQPGGPRADGKSEMTRAGAHTPSSQHHKRPFVPRLV